MNTIVEELRRLAEIPPRTATARRQALFIAANEIETLQNQVATLHRDKGLLMELCVLKNDALQLAHDNWSDCFHDAVSTCKICQARDADLPKEKT